MAFITIFVADFFFCTIFFVLAQETKIQASFISRYHFGQGSPHPSKETDYNSLVRKDVQLWYCFTLKNFCQRLLWPTTLGSFVIVVFLRVVNSGNNYQFNGMHLGILLSCCRVRSVSYEVWNHCELDQWRNRTQHFLSTMWVNTLRPEQNDQHFVDNIFQYIFFNEIALISTRTLLDLWR